MTMVERVARAIALAPDPEFRGDTEPSRNSYLLAGTDSDWQRFLPAARAAIDMREPTETMWSGLARQIIMWDRSANPRGQKLHHQLRMTGCPIPEWLEQEIPNTGHCPAKGAVAVAIFRAMIDAALAEGSDG